MEAVLFRSFIFHRAGLGAEDADVAVSLPQGQGAAVLQCVGEGAVPVLPAPLDGNCLAAASGAGP